MLKRAAENQDEGPEAKKLAAGGKGGGAGGRAEEVKNPIPRLFKQNSITIHITQRTFEEVGPGELKWIPTCQYYAAMFDKFHARMFQNYYPRCSTFQISDPKIRISNLLMLQDDQVTQAGTPKDVSVFTQACYLMHYQPRGIKNWFKLGTSGDNMVSQKYLTYKPMEATDGKTISQLIKLDNYVDFEQLVINPSKADFYAGWHSGETNAATVDPTSLNCQLLDSLEGEVNVDDTKLEPDKDYYVTECFISPRSPYLGSFSCSVKGCEPHVEMSKHTTYARNLDKINLHKYGDSFGFHINTNLEGKHMLKHEANNPFGHVFVKGTKSSTKADTSIYSVFCYPSDNRPFYSRYNNFDPNGPVDGNKGFTDLTHHFFTMPPIKKGNDALLLQRCSFIMEQSMSITFHFPETVSEDSAEDLLRQKDAIVIRPAIVKLKKEKTTQSPDKPPIFDFVRDKAREAIKGLTNVTLPGNPSFRDRAIGSRVPIRNRRWSIPSILSELCETLGLEPVCSNLGEIIRKGVGNRPLAINWDTISSAYQRGDITVITETEMIDGIIIPKVKPRFAINTATQLTDDEIDEMNDKFAEVRNVRLAAYLFYHFLYTLQKNKLLFQDDMPTYNDEYPQQSYDASPYNNSKHVVYWLKPHVDAALENIYQQKCDNTVLRIFPDQLTALEIWNRKEQSPNWDKKENVNFKSLNPGAFSYPVDFYVSDWIKYLYQMRLWVMTKLDIVKDFLEKYNNCVNQQIDTLYPRIVLTRDQINILKKEGLLEGEPQNVEPNPMLDEKYMNYTTSMFFQ